MDKKVIFAVAGSGKTSHILNQLNLEKKALIITYTNSNYENLKHGIIKKFNYMPDNIRLLSYFKFLYSFCYKPFLSYDLPASGINWNPNLNFYAKDDARYIDKNRRLYSNRIAKLLEEKEIFSDIRARLAKYYDILFIDEIQDFGGHDFNFLKNISSAQIEMLFVGDFYQHTFDTSRDGTVNKNLHKDYTDYQNFFRKMNFVVDVSSLIKSHRCGPTVCKFITDNLGVIIESHRLDISSVIELSLQQIDEIFNDNNIVKLFYREHYKYECYSKNWGDCKGEDKYNNVCVVFNKTSFDLYKKSSLRNSAELTKNKLYVALSRTRGTLYLMSEQMLKKYKTG